MLKKILSHLSFQVFLAILLGVILGHFFPEAGTQMKPLGDLFISLIRMLISPIVFLTVVLGISKAGNLKQVGRVGAKTLIYFEIVTTLALVIGISIAWLIRPGNNIDPNKLSKGDISAYTKGTEESGILQMLLHIVPDNFIKAFADGNILQVLFFAILFGIALSGLTAVREPVIRFFENLSHVFFRMLSFIMKLAPLGAFAGMAFTIGKFGIGSLVPLAQLMLCVYATMAVFVFLLLNLLLRYYKISLWRFLIYIREEILLVLGTSSSESALPGMMEKMEELGCSRQVVGIVIPAGYSFNLDGTSIYLAMSTLFLAQAYQIDLSALQILSILGILMITSKGAAGVTGSGFIVLASTLAATKIIPVEGMAILLGVDRFMSEARAITNLIGNGVAALIVASNEGELDRVQLNRILKHPEFEHDYDQ